MLKLALALLALSTTASANEVGPIFDCGDAIDSVGKGTPCREVIGYGLPTDLGGAAIKLYRFNDTWDSHPEFEVTLKQIAESAIKSVKYFAQFGKLPSIGFYFVNEAGTDAANARWEYDPCNVTVFFGFSESPELARQTIAHEVFHCFQSNNIYLPEGYRPHHSSSWWVEGGADYFGNLVYPTANLEYGHQLQYSILNPLTQQPDDYATSLFFQFLQNKGMGDVDTIVGLLKSLPRIHNPEGMIDAVSKWPNIGQLFHDFIIAVLDRTIIDTSGSTPGYPDASVDFAVLDLDPASPGPTIGVQPLRAGGAAFRLPKGSEVKLSVTQAQYNSGTRVSYRAKGGSEWTPMAPAHPYEAKTPCNAAKATEVEFLITTTAPEANQMVELQQEAKAQKCLCAAPRATLDPCLLGDWEIDHLATAAALEEEFKKNEPAEGFRLEYLLVTGDFDLKIKTGPSATQHIFGRADTTTIWKHTETGAKNSISTIIDALTVVTLLQDDDHHVCMKYDAADGTVTTISHGKRKELPASKVMVGEIMGMKYTCTQEKLELWYALDQTIKPFHTYRRKR